MNSPADTLAAALSQCGVDLPADQIQRLDTYCQLLWEWNAKLNLTRHTDYPTFAARDVVDSLVLAEALGPGEPVLDVGTGGGVPGVVLAILRDDLEVTLCESVGKKAQAVADIVERLGLSVPVFHARAEDVLQGNPFDTLVLRAVARLKKLLVWFGPCRGSFERLLVLKGPAWAEERGEARHFGLMQAWELRKLKEYRTPGSQAENVLLQIRPKGAV